MVTDPIGDLIIQLKNAGAIGKEAVVLPHSRHKHDVAAKLSELGYVGKVSKEGKEKPVLQIMLSYTPEGEPKIRGVERVSKPGRRLYTGAKDAHSVRFGKGDMIISTPRGILSDREARKFRVGGELLFKIW